VDAGLSAKKLTRLLADEGLDTGELDAVFLTHEHADHSAGVRGLSKKANLPIFANQDTANAVQAQLSRRPNWQIFETGHAFNFRGLRVQPFSVPHDAYDPVGFYFEWGGEDLFNPLESLAWVTDLGYAPELVKEKIAQASILVIEANHCPRMLERDTKRPWSLKQRILGRHGHLSNKATLELLKSIENPRWQEIFLMHLSKDCNDVNLVRDSFAELSTDTYVVDPSTAEAIPV
jgi:phosphoribosyl 1,2-cyclic phosphodiesterase